MSKPMSADPTVSNQLQAFLVHEGGASSADLRVLKAAGLPWLVIFQLFFQYGPQVIEIIKAILALIAKPGGATIGDIAALIQQYGDKVKEIVSVIFGALGKPVPA